MRTILKMQLKLGLFLLAFTQLTIGLQIEKDKRDQLEKVLDDRVQNIELDGDNLDFPGWSPDFQSTDEAEEIHENNAEDLHEESEEVKEKNETGGGGSMKITDLIEKYLTKHLNKPIENNNNRWSFWKDFVQPHSSHKNIWTEHFGFHPHVQSQSLGFGNHWSSLRDLFQPTPPPPQNNWWSQIFSANSRLDSEDSADSMITFYHKMTVDNKTREGVAKVSSSQVMPFMRTVWNSLSSDSHLALGVGAFLPFLGLLLPAIIFATIIPIIFLVMFSVFGLMSGALVLMPLLLTGLVGQGALPVDRMIEELFLEEFDGAGALKTILQLDLQQISDEIEDSTDKAVDEIEEIPRYLKF